MKFFHLADLHLGKRVNEFDLLADQRYILEQILGHARCHRPDAVLIAGDLYDRPVPSEAAVELLDWFLTALSALGCAVLAVSGNHDSPERLSFASQLLQRSRVYFAGDYPGAPVRVTLPDPDGPVDVTLLPFLKPSTVAPFLEERPRNTHQAVAAALAALPPVAGRRNLLVAHQFVTAAGHSPQTCDSEIAPVGGADPVDAGLFAGYDYVALGHLHGPQQLGRQTVRYAGSPLKYSFSETRHHKSLPLVTLPARGPARVELLPLTPLHELRELKGPLQELLDPARVCDPQDYLHVTLTDEEELLDAVGRVRAVYPNLMRLDFDNRRTRAAATGQTAAEAAEQKSLPQLFDEFYRLMNGGGMSPGQQALFEAALKQTGGEAE